MTSAALSRAPRFRFDRNELAGAFGDIGTDLPLIVGMVLASGLDATGVLVTFGLMQWATALSYGMPMPVQPLKAMAAIVITQQIAPPIIFGAGLAVGASMLVLTATGLIDWLARVVPRAVVRGLQLGLGVQLSLLALREYAPSGGSAGWALAAVAFVVTLALRENRRFPPALIVVALGIAYALAFDFDVMAVAGGASLTLPEVPRLSWDAVVTGFFVLALPQIPLSLGNSLLATRQAAADLFPNKRITMRKLGFTYSGMNLMSPLLGGVPVCHGSGGLVGHYAFGARTGTSVLIYGSIYLVLGLFFSGVFEGAVKVFPLPALAVLLLFEGLALAALARDTAGDRFEFFIVLLVAFLAFGLPYGYLAALVVGTGVWHLRRRLI